METSQERRLIRARAAMIKAGEDVTDAEVAFKLISKAFKQVRVKLKEAKRKHKAAIKRLEKLQEGKA